MIDKLCIDCIYQNNDDPTPECLQCRQKNNWQSKCCASCKHDSENPFEEPCSTCKNYSHWKPDEDDVNHPDHYTQGGIECIDAIRASMTPDEYAGYLKGNIQKYLWRYEHKGGVQDLEKAMWYLDRLIKHRREQWADKLK